MKNVLWMIAALAIMLPTAAVAQNSWVKVPDTLQQKQRKLKYYITSRNRLQFVLLLCYNLWMCL